MSPVLQHAAIRAVDRLVWEEPPPVRAQRRMTEDRPAEPSHPRPRVPMRLQRGAIRVVGLVEDRQPEEVLVPGLRTLLPRHHSAL